MRAWWGALLICSCGGAGEGTDATDTDTDESGPSTSVSPTSPSDPSTSSSASTTTPSTTDTMSEDSSTTAEAATGPSGCGGDDECSAPTPHCSDEGECVECTEHAHCDSAACDLETNTCFEGEAIAVAVGYGFRRVWSADGIAWQDLQELNPNGGDDNQLLRGVGYGDGVFVAVGGGGLGVSITSTNGVDWENQNDTPPSFLSDVVWLGDAFVAAGGNGLRLRSTDGGQTWGDQAPYISGHFRGIATDGTIAVAVGHTYGDEDIGMWSTTTDGVSWTPEQTGGTPFSSIASGNGTFVAAGAEGRVSSSSDGASWDDQSLGTSPFFVVAYAGDEFLVAAEGTLWSSPDGGAWTEVEGVDSRPVSAYFMGGYFALGWPATIERSDDLVAYENVFEPGGSGFTDIAVGVPGT
jgi:hypothetical protein